jgi:pepF/M3 family oligoendopeptidase
MSNASGLASATWDLDSLFAGGAHSAVFATFLDTLHDQLEGLRALSRGDTTAGPAPVLAPDLDDAWPSRLDAWQSCAAALEEAASYAECLAAADTDDIHAKQLLARLDELAAQLKAIEVDLERGLLALTASHFQRLLDTDAVRPIAFALTERRQVAAVKMPAEQERLVEQLASDGYHAWGRLYGHLAGSLRAPADGAPAGGGDRGGIARQQLSMGQLVHRLEDPRGDVRRRAQAQLEATWAQVEDQAAMALNHQAGFRLAVYRARGWQSVLQEPLQLNRMTADSLEAMWAAVAAGAANLTPYLARKAKLLGADGVYWHDQFAPVGGLERSYSIQEARDYILEHFRSFSSGLAAFAEHAFAERWIETEDRSGKAAGGFCTHFPVSRQARIFMTFGNTFGGVTTLAHELGHAYHAWLLKDRPYFATGYPMTLAETASTFCEALITDAALAGAETGAARLALLGSMADEAVTMMMNLRSRFLFETDFFEHRRAAPLRAEELSELMVDAQRRAFCGALAPDGYHPRFWASKLHFYITEYPFYNFPYVFGFLFSNGIYARAKAEGTGFAGAYAAMLEDTGSMTCEALAAAHLGVDLREPDFWEAAVASVLAVVPQFLSAADHSISSESTSSTNS